MKKLLTIAAVLIALTATASAQAPVLNRTQEYRIWSAERMIDRLEKKYGKPIAANPVLASIREIAANGDDVDWARLIDAVHKFEKDTEAALNR
jgi:hypothetical protein